MRYEINYLPVLLVVGLSACASAPDPGANADAMLNSETSASNQIDTKNGVIEVSNTDIDNLSASDQDVVVHSGKALRDCRRRKRTGTRIPRDVCDPSAFNGLYPGPSINLGTHGEGQSSPNTN